MTRTRSTRRSLRRSLAVAGSVLALLGATTACGDDPDSAADPVASTPSSTPSPTEDADEPAPRAGGEEVSAGDFVEVFRAATEKATTASITMQQSASGLEASGILDYTSDPISMQMEMTLASMGDIEMRLVDNVMYMKLPMLGNKFVAYDLDDPSNPLGDSFSELFSLDTMIDTFAEGIESATYVGNEDVGGEAFDHYTVVTDTSALLDDLSVPTPSGIEIPETQTMDVWFDEDGFFRRVETDLGELGTTDITYDDWGTDVSVEAPPADQVTTMPSGTVAG